MHQRARVAVLHPYWTFWEHTAPEGFRARRLAQVGDLVDSLPANVEVVGVQEVSSDDDGRKVGKRLATDGVDAVLVVQTMAVPPTYAMAALDELDRVPVVIWALQEHGRVEAGFDHGDITTQGATVGAPMLTNALTRQGRGFALEFGHMGDTAHHARVSAALAAAAAAGRLRRARIGRVGRPLDGYIHVDVDEAALRSATGITLVSIDPAEVTDRYRRIDGDRLAALEAEVRQGWSVADDVGADDGLERSLKVALALEDLVAEHDLDAGAMNCHVPEIRFGDEIGVTPC